MKKIYSLLLTILCTSILWAQSPEKMSYQAVIRDADNALAATQAVTIQVTLLQGSVSGNLVYQERHSTTTNGNGLVSFEIGGGAVASGDFAAIDWANGPYFIKTETDPTGGNDYALVGVSQLLSVPYALHAKTADNGITTAQSAAITANTAKEGITAEQATILGNTSNTNTGDQDGSETKVQGSTHITVTGDGTSGSPYIVSSSDIADLLTELEALKNRVAVLEGGSTPYKPGVSVQDNLDNGVSILDLLEHVTVDELYGKTYEGGLIFYVNETDGTGLVAAPIDQANSAIGRAEWGCYGTAIGAYGMKIGTGAQNTLGILAGCSETGTAAQLCADLVLNEKEDWFLPSKDELNAMYVNLKENGFGGFANYKYWSSSENGSHEGWIQYFTDGLQYGNAKGNYSNDVRAVRAF